MSKARKYRKILRKADRDYPWTPLALALVRMAKKYGKQPLLVNPRLQMIRES